MMAIETLAPNVAHLFSTSRLSEAASRNHSNGYNHRQNVTLSPVINKLAKSVKCNEKISQKFTQKITYPKTSTTNSSPKKVQVMQNTSRTRSVSYNVENLNSNSTVKNQQPKKYNNRKDEKSSSGCHSDTSTTSSKKRFVKVARLHTKEEQKKIENTRSRSPTNSRQHRNSFSRMISNEQGGHYARHAETFAGCAASPAATALPRPPVSWLKSSQVPTEKFNDNSHISTKIEQAYIMKQQPSTSENVQEFFNSFQSLMVSTA